MSNIIALDYLENCAGLLWQFFILSVINVNCSNWNMLVAIFSEQQFVAETCLLKSLNIHTLPLFFFCTCCLADVVEKAAFVKVFCESWQICLASTPLWNKVRIVDAWMQWSVNHSDNSALIELLFIILIMLLFSQRFFLSCLVSDACKLYIQFVLVSHGFLS